MGGEQQVPCGNDRKKSKGNRNNKSNGKRGFPSGMTTKEKLGEAGLVGVGCYGSVDF